MADRYVLRLYVTGQTPRSQAAVRNMREIIEQDLDDDYVLEVVDVLEQPDVAEDVRIIATPTLIKELPPPLRRIIGDLSDRERVLLGLDLSRT